MPGLNFGSEFDDFLYAPIAEESNGMTLSVLSALARQDVDPWEEAAMLTRLPGETAIRKLAALIAALPNGLAVRIDPESVAVRLVALLPGRPVHESRSRAASATLRLSSPAATAQPPPAKRTTFAAYMMLYAAFMAILLVIQWLGADRQSAAATDAAAVAQQTATTGANTGTTATTATTATSEP